MLILAMVIFSPISLESSSSAGAIMRHGPHHSAQKSTTTGFLELRTSAWNEASETLIGDDMTVLWLRTVLESRNADPQGQGARRFASVGRPRAHWTVSSVWDRPSTRARKRFVCAERSSWRQPDRGSSARRIAEEHWSRSWVAAGWS